MKVYSWDVDLERNGSKDQERESGYYYNEANSVAVGGGTLK